jgi:multicomponent Na+:H+ antiporter subunit F
VSTAAVLLTVALALLGLSLLLGTVRFVLGPSALDRLVSLDAIVAVVMCALMAHVAMTHDSASVPAVVAISLVGFLGSSTVARVVGRRSGDGSADSADEGEP